MSTTSASEAVEALTAAASAVGLTVRSAEADTGSELILVGPQGDEIPIDIKRVSLVSIDTVERQIAQWRSSRRLSSLRVIVADRITEHARQALREAGWSWLDLRGHVHLVSDGLFVDADIPALRAKAAPPKPLAGRAGQEVAALLLLDPGRPASIREIARTLGRSASTVSQAIQALRDASLVDQQRKPVTPDLFWALAERWHPQPNDVRLNPSQADTPAREALRLGLDTATTTVGWALTDTMAAAAYGAPVGTRSDYPPDFYVPDESTMRRAIRLLGVASSHDNRAATIRVAPLSLICLQRVNWPGATWPLAKPLFVALDLAADPGRGREVLAGWTPPPEAGQRVW